MRQSKKVASRPVVTSVTRFALPILGPKNFRLKLWNSKVRPLISFQPRAIDIVDRAMGLKPIAMAERRPVEQMELSEEEAMSPEHLDSQVQKAQEQLLQLKRQSEQIEKQKRELEELSRKQEDLEKGRADMIE